MTLLNLVLPLLKKFKFIAILVVVFAVSFMCAKRWPSFLPPWLVTCTISVGVTLIIILVYLAVKKRREKKMAAALEAGISAADEDKVDLKGEIKALRENWQSSLAKLKASGMGADSKTILFKLPWYIIIGEPASGKSTLLRKSGLDFPVGDATVAGLHGTRNCDWWFANEAIFLDTAGRYIIETQVQEWTAFLELLQKYRTKKPINGVMIALPANSLLTKNHDELLGDGKRIRGRIDELIEGLGINFPIYVLVTKCDLVSGFVEFFGNLDRRHAEQMVGWTNPQDATARFDGDAFDQKFKEVNTRLFEMRPWLESQAKKRDLMKAFLYPEEFSYLNQPVRTVLDVVFKANVYQETPVCRGVYFSSGTQVGSPLALALDDMARDLGISSDFGFGLTMEEEKELRAYFIKDLVGEQILKDQEMNWRTQTSETKVKKRRMGWGLVGVAISVLLALFVTKSFIQNQSRLSDFKVSIPEGSRPLEAATGCLKTRDDAVKPGLMDVGLNYSDELIPSMDVAFRSVFARGCLNPLLTDLAKPIKAGVKKDENGSPDLKGYIQTWEHYVYLRDGPPDERNDAEEEPHLKALFTMLRDHDGTGRGTRDDFRYALKEYGGLGTDDDTSGRRREIETAFAHAFEPIVGNAETWIAGVEASDQNLEQRFNDAIAKLKKSSFRGKTRVAAHDSKDVIASIARDIKTAAGVKQGGGAGSLDLEGFAGVTESSDLARLLNLVKASYPDKDEIPAEDAPKGEYLPDRIDKVTEKLSLPLAQENLRAPDAARQKIVAFLDKVIAGENEPFPYEILSRQALLDRQSEINEEIASAEAAAWSEIKDAVTELEGSPVESTDAEGQTTRKEGWWDTLPMLARARLTDLRKDAYLAKGLEVYLMGEKWHRQRPADEKEEIYNKTRLENRIIPLMREQLAFFKDESVATDLSGLALAAAKKGVNGYLESLADYWTEQFETGLPESAAVALPEIYTQLGEWQDNTSNLRRVCLRIRTALYDVTAIEGPENDPVLEATQKARRDLFNQFVVCFDPGKEKVATHATVAEAAGKLNGVIRQLDQVVGQGFGGVKQSAARVLVGQILTGGSTTALVEARKAVKGFRKELNSEPAKILAKRLETLIRNAWDALVGYAVKDINEEWSTRTADWRAQMERGDPLTFRRIFGKRNSELIEFQKEYIDPFFGPKNRATLEVDGARIALLPGLRTFATDLRSFGGAVFTEEGNIRSDTLEVSLKIAGKAPVGLKLHYQDSSASTPPSDEKRTDEARVTFRWTWSPTTCESFSMEVFFRDNSSKKLPRAFIGKWAVAEALSKAERNGNTFTWTGTDETHGEWEIQLTFLTGGPGGLYGVYKQAKGQDPLQWIVTTLPDQVVK